MKNGIDEGTTNEGWEYTHTYGGYSTRRELLNDNSTNKLNPRKGPAAPANERVCTDGTKNVESTYMKRSRSERLENTHVPERWDRKAFKKILVQMMSSRKSDGQRGSYLLWRKDHQVRVEVRPSMVPSKAPGHLNSVSPKRKETAAS